MTWHRALPAGVLSLMKRSYDEHAARRRRTQSERNLVQAAVSLSDTCLGEEMSLETWASRTADRRRELAWMLGLEPSPDRTPLDAVTVGLLERPHFTIERVVFQSLPGLYVTANFYVPTARERPVPCVVYLSGHWPSLRGAKTGFQERYLWYPAHGFACLAVDPLGFGEVPGIHHGAQLGLGHWLSLGYSPAGVEVWNAMRAIDWLADRQEVDSSRIGVTGVSGGGVMTQYLAALDERVSVAASSCATYTIGSQAALRIVPEQCDCTFLPNVCRFDFPLVSALIAPRPLMILGGRRDRWFPPAGFRPAFELAKRIYDLYAAGPGQRARLRLVETPAGHADPPQSLRECQRWMKQWLKPALTSPPDVSEDWTPESEPAEVLACLESVPASARNFHVHETWVEPAQREAAFDSNDWSIRREKVIGFLTKRVFEWFPKDNAPFRTRQLKGSGGYASEFAEFGDYEFDSEPSVPVRAMVLRARSASAPLLVWVRRACEQVGFPALDEVLPILPETSVLILMPRFSDQVLPASEFSRIERTAALSGRTVAALGVWDVMRSIAWAETELGLSAEKAEVFGRGEAGVIGLYAALLEERVGHVVVGDLPPSHRQGPALLTILRQTDIPEIAAALAPRRLSVLGLSSPTLDLPRRVYEMVGAASQFSMKASLAEAILETRLRSGAETAVAGHRSAAC